jgi:hypothetical protein
LVISANSRLLKNFSFATASILHIEQQGTCGKDKVVMGAAQRRAADYCKRTAMFLYFPKEVV